MDSEHLLILLIFGFQDMTLDFVINRWRARLKGGRRSLVILQASYQNRKNSKITKLFLRGLRCPSTPPARAIVSSGRPPWRQWTAFRCQQLQSLLVFVSFIVIF